MGLITKPLLASAAVLEKVRYPVLATPKLDGIRALIIDGKLVSRKFKPIPNVWIAKQLEKILPENSDGEILSGTTFQETSSAVMTINKPNIDFVYHWFDWVTDALETPYKERMVRLSAYPNVDLNQTINKVIPMPIENEQQLLEYEEKCLAEGYEGIMIRDPLGPYKCGRSSVNQGILLKVKRVKDAEARITGFEEMMHNMNEAKKDAFGRTERSTSKEGKVPAGTLGKFLVEGVGDYDGVPLEIGTGKGLTHKLRQEIWDNREKYLGKLIKYKYQVQGTKNLPRFPIFLGFRHEDDC